MKSRILKDVYDAQRRPSPCKSCPWRRGSDDAKIPGFDKAKACNLKRTCSPDSHTTMACHASPFDRPSICHGFAQSDDAPPHIGLRIASALGLANGAQDRREDCFATYAEMAEHHGWFDEEGK